MEAGPTLSKSAMDGIKTGIMVINKECNKWVL